jgi:hypothetical protein
LEGSNGSYVKGLPYQETDATFVLVLFGGSLRAYDESNQLTAVSCVSMRMLIVTQRLSHQEALPDIGIRPCLQAAQKSEFLSFGGTISYPRRGSILFVRRVF